MSEEHHQELGFLQILILILSVYILIALFIDTVYQLPPEVSHVLQISDFGICIIFLFDFCYRFYKAESKLKFMTWGWIDLISSIPNVDMFRGARIIRIIRIIRVLRVLRSAKIIVGYVLKNRRQGAISSVVIIAVILVLVSSVSILNVETDPNSNIKTAEDAI